MTALELVKSRDSMQALILFIRSEPAQRIMAAWPMLGAHVQDRPIKKGETFDAAAVALWLEAHKTFAMQDLADQSDVPYTICEKIFFRLTRAGIVYPDGTISPNATNLLVTRAIAHVKSLNRGKPYDGARPNPPRESVPQPDNDGLPKGRAAQSGADKARHEPAGKPGGKARRPDRQNTKEK